jgi:hypothetical protein
MEERDRNLLSRMLGPGVSDEVVGTAGETIKELAFREWMDWIAGEYRPISISQSNVDRIARIYGLVIKDVPTLNDLVNIFSFPIGRARYIISVLSYERNRDFRRGLLAKIAAVLVESIQGKEDEDLVTPFVESALLSVLDELEQEILYVDDNLDYERCEKLPGFPGIGRECMFTVSNAKIVIQKLQAKVASLGPGESERR